MFDENNITIVNNSSVVSVEVISFTVKFWLYLIFLIPSILCTLFLLYCLLSDRNLRRALINHVIILLLITILSSEITVYPWMLYYYRQGGNWQRSYTFCSLWAFMDRTLYTMQIMLFAWASIERHILIFHDNWVATRRKRFFIHYLPVIIIVMYYFIFYSIMFFFSTCQNTLTTSSMICLSVCLYNLTTFRVVETTVNNIIPSFIITIFSIALIIRVLRQKQRMLHAIQWRRHRKMTVQLVSISFLYLIIICPYGIITFLNIFGQSSNVSVIFANYGVFFTYYIILLFPFVSMFSIPELGIKTRAILQSIRRPVRLIGPQVMAMQNGGRNRGIVRSIN